MAAVGSSMRWREFMSQKSDEGNDPVRSSCVLLTDAFVARMRELGIPPNALANADDLIE